MLEIEYRSYKNTNKFRQPAIHFQKHGYYISAPRGTTEYIEYWDKEIERCLEGFTAEDGDHITGYHYFYLNYCPIILVKEAEVEGPNGKIEKRNTRERDFPNFWDSDKQFFDAVEEAERQGKHLVVIKARGKGYSYKTASMLIRNFFLVEESKSYAIASEMEFLTKDGILTKAWDMMDFVDEHTAWTKKRQSVNTKMHKRASYISDNNGTKVETGFKSEIIGITLKNDTQKARGKRAKLILWEESGKFPGLLEAWQIAQPSVEEGGVAFGLMIAFGTGGTEEGEYGSLKELFYNPKGYNCLEINNRWDNGADGSGCGFFIPEYMNMTKEFMDSDGNTLISQAQDRALDQRQNVEANSNDKNAIDRYIAERPFTPMEATLQLAGNIFPKKDLAEHLSRIQANKKLSNFKQVGDLIFDDGGNLKWVQSKYPKDVKKYPLDRNDDKKGSIVIWEHPPEEIPYGLYIGGCDPYDHDDSGTGSLGSTFIYKRFQSFEEYYDIIVAEYTGRPDTADEYYENVRRLLLYYNAVLLFENERKGIFPYFVSKGCDYLLADQPDIINDIIRDSKVKRRKGVHMVDPLKDYGEREIKDWLNYEISPGIKNLTKIMSVPLLQELISYNPKGNFDRVMALMMVMLYRKELHKVHVKEKQQINRIDPFFKDRVFTKDRLLQFNSR
jgi:hypothetical protein